MGGIRSRRGVFSRARLCGRCFLFHFGSLSVMLRQSLANSNPTGFFYCRRCCRYIRGDLLTRSRAGSLPGFLKTICFVVIRAALAAATSQCRVSSKGGQLVVYDVVIFEFFLQRIRKLSISDSVVLFLRRLHTFCSIFRHLYQTDVSPDRA